MKRTLLLGLFAAALSITPSIAAVTIEEHTDVDYLINAGYSEAAAEGVFMQKNRANANRIEPLYSNNSNVFARGWRAFWGYIDPAKEQNDKLHHDIQQSSSWRDL